MNERDLAQIGLKQIQDSVLSLLRQRPEGMKNAQIAEELDLRSDFRGRQRDYLTYSVLGGLLRQGRVVWSQDTKKFSVPDS